MWKRESSDCIHRKSLSEVALAPENTATRKKNRLFDDRKRRESRHRNVRRACKSSVINVLAFCCRDCNDTINDARMILAAAEMYCPEAAAEIEEAIRFSLILH